MRALQTVYADLRAREEQAAREGDVWIGKGVTGQAILYFPMNPGYGDSLQGAVVRRAARVGRGTWYSARSAPPGRGHRSRHRRPGAPGRAALTRGACRRAWA